MAKLFKPLFQCEGCGETFEDPNKVRLFDHLVKNGDETKQFIDGGMYCIDCVPLVLDFENKNPETVKIVDRQELEKNQEIKEKPITMSDIENKFVEINKQYSKSFKTHQQKIDELFESLKSQNQTNFKNEIIEDEQEKNISIIDHQEEFIIEEDQISQNEPEITTEIIDSETETVIDELIETKPFGKYVILQMITSGIYENHLAKKCGYKDVKSLREIFGNKSLLGIYYSTEKFSDTLSVLNENYQQETVSVINKIFFGVPNVVQRKAHVYQDTGIALMDKQLFDDKIENVKYEQPEEINEEIKENKSINTILQDFTKPIDKSEKNFKKKFSKDTIGDDYI